MTYRYYLDCGVRIKKGLIKGVLVVCNKSSKLQLGRRGVGIDAAKNPRLLGQWHYDRGLCISKYIPTSRCHGFVRPLI